MFLRNKIATLSVTLMSLMTIPTLAENDNPPVNSRIESTNFDVQINTPEGWSETKDFSNSIPKTFTMNGATYRGLQFRNESNGHGCVVFFTENGLDHGVSEIWGVSSEISHENVSCSLPKSPETNASFVETPPEAASSELTPHLDHEDDDQGSLKNLAEVIEVAFPGSDLSTFTVSKVNIDGSLAANINTETTKVSLKGTIEGNMARETGDPTKLTITGKIDADSTKGNFIVGTGTVSPEGAMPISGTVGIQQDDKYELIIAIWGTDEASQIKHTLRFIQATRVTKKAPVETAVEPIAVPTNDAVVASETPAEATGGAVVVTESVAVGEAAPVKKEAGA